MLGQVGHFFRFAKEDVPYAKERYLTEAKRLLTVLDKGLEGGLSTHMICLHVLMGSQLGRIAILRLRLLTVLDKDLEGGWAVHTFVFSSWVGVEFVFLVGKL